ncbi:9921_t:CDS:2, partial [Ambispora leptoticha]
TALNTQKDKLPCYFTGSDLDNTLRKEIENADRYYEKTQNIFYDTLGEHKIMYKDAECRPGLDFGFNDAFLFTDVQLKNIITDPGCPPHPAFRFVASTVIPGFPHRSYEIVTNAPIDEIYSVVSQPVDDEQTTVATNYDDHDFVISQIVMNVRTTLACTAKSTLISVKASCSSMPFTSDGFTWNAAEVLNIIMSFIDLLLVRYRYKADYAKHDHELRSHLPLLLTDENQDAEYNKNFCTTQKKWLTGFRNIESSQLEIRKGNIANQCKNLVMTNGYGVFALIVFKFIKNYAKRSSQKVRLLKQARQTKQLYVNAYKDIVSVVVIFGAIFTNEKGGTLEFMNYMDKRIASAVNYCRPVERAPYIGNLPRFECV